MADNFNLPPDAEDFTLSVTLHRQAMPYITGWYNDQKRAGETPPQFLRRLLYREAMQHQLNKIRGQIDAERMGAEDAARSGNEALESDFAATLDTVESL
jgi:hypothetical protein